MDTIGLQLTLAFIKCAFCSLLLSLLSFFIYRLVYFPTIKTKRLNEARTVFATLDKTSIRYANILTGTLSGTYIYTVGNRLYRYRDIIGRYCFNHEILLFYNDGYERNARTIKRFTGDHYVFLKFYSLLFILCAFSYFMFITLNILFKRVS